ncbi:hypothetical protein JCM11641_006742 [Rhodosporidiobolus odoratus]
MPRPRQRKGASARQEEKQAKREQQEQEAAAQLAREKRERERKTRMEWDALPSASSHNSAGEPDPDALPEPDPDTKAYFKKLAEQIEEMTALRNGARGAQTQWVVNEEGEEVEEEIEDERPLLLRSALESLSGHEVSLAGDGESSVVLEQLLYAMDDFAKRVLLDRFSGMFEKLVKHRSASHVLQTLFELTGETVHRETRGEVATGPSGSDTSDLPTMTSLLLSLLQELLPTISTLIYDSFASHTIRILLLVFSGVPCSSSSTSTSSGPSSAAAARSKKSTNFRKNQGASFGKNWLADDASLTTAQQAGAKGKAKAAEARLAVPSSFGDALKEIYVALDGLDADAASMQGAQNAVPGEGVRKAAMHEVAGPVMRILIELEAAQPDGGWTAGGWADRVLCGLVSEVLDPESVAKEQREAAKDLREEYLAGLLRHPASSPTFEMILHLAHPPIFSPLWSQFFAGKVHRLAANAVANFVVAVGISRVGEEEMKGLVQELRAVPTERRGEWIDNFRTGVLRALMESASRLQCCEGEVAELMLDTFGLKTEDEKKLVVPCVLTLNRLQYWKKLATGATPEPSTQGSVLLQTWLKMHAPHQQVVFDSIASLPFDTLLPLTRSTTSSRIFDALLGSPTTPPRALRTFILSLIGHFPELADDRIGSRVAERAFAAADVFLKDKIAASVFDHQDELQRSAYAHFLARKMELPLWGRRRDDWKAKMARLSAEEKARQVALESPAPSASAPVPAAAGGESKKRARKVDDIDAIFASGGAVVATAPSEAATNGKAGGGEDEERAAKRARKEAKRAKKAAVGGGSAAEGVDDVLKAIKASVSAILGLAPLPRSFDAVAARIIAWCLCALNEQHSAMLPFALFLLTFFSSFILAQDVPSSAPRCVRNCFNAKLREAAILAPSTRRSNVLGLCASEAFVRAYNTCLTDNCSPQDVVEGQAMGNRVCDAAAASSGKRFLPP